MVGTDRRAVRREKSAGSAIPPYQLSSQIKSNACRSPAGLHEVCMVRKEFRHSGWNRPPPIHSPPGNPPNPRPGIPGRAQGREPELFPTVCVCPRRSRLLLAQVPQGAGSPHRRGLTVWRALHGSSAKPAIAGGSRRLRLRFRSSLSRRGEASSNPKILSSIGPVRRLRSGHPRVL